jgi:hypothetical protein
MDKARNEVSIENCELAGGIIQNCICRG